MNKNSSSCRLATITQYLVLLLLLSQSTTTHAEINPTLWNIGSTSFGCAVGLVAFVLEFKKPEKDAPTLKKHAGFLDKLLYQLDRIIGQKKRTKFYEDENGNMRVTKINSRGLGTLYLTFKQLLPALAIFQTWDKAQKSFDNFAENTGINGALGLNTKNINK